MVFHIDGNSFYASCERLFRPDLRGKPIAVLTNNDGIIIALTQECKDLGFKRGDVYFENREKLEAAGVEVFSSNYTLYADISRRLNNLYSRYAPDVEFYSIDESFLDFPDWSNADYTAIGREIKEAASTEIGVPVSVGIAPNKTLAKMCNKLAKKYGGVCHWNTIDRDAALAAYPVGDIWGIGRSKAAFLNAHGVQTALQLKSYPLNKAKQHLTINGFRTVQELNGIKAIMYVEPKERQGIIVSRSFSQAVYNIEEIRGCLAQYTQEAVKRLRGENSNCRTVCVYLMTNPYSGGGQYTNSAQKTLGEASSYFPIILKTALDLLNGIYRRGYKYRKVMVGLMELTPEKNAQPGLFSDRAETQKNERLMSCFDDINTRYGRNVLHLGTSALAAKAEDGIAPWEMKREYLSPCYTTRIADYPVVY
jgi:DNA polymerase V